MKCGKKGKMKTFRDGGTEICTSEKLKIKPGPNLLKKYPSKKSGFKNYRTIKWHKIVFLSINFGLYVYVMFLLGRIGAVFAVLNSRDGALVFFTRPAHDCRFARD